MTQISNVGLNFINFWCSWFSHFVENCNVRVYEGYMNEPSSLSNKKNPKYIEVYLNVKF